jgi:hypothetical protein
MLLLIQELPVTLFPIEVKSVFVVIAYKANATVAATVAAAQRRTLSGVYMDVMAETM